MPNAPAKGSVSLEAIDTLPQKQRRWSVHVQAALGLPNLLGQNQVLASAIATSARIEETTLRAGAGQHCAKNLRLAHPNLTGQDEFAAFIAELDAFERVKPPRPQDAAQTLRMAAEAALDSVDDDAMRAACEDAIAQLEMYDLRTDIAVLGPPPWDSLGAMKGSAAKTKLDLLSIPQDRRQLVSLGGGSANATFWINRTDGMGKDAKSFLCKPAGQGKKVSGIPQGGEVAREQLAARTATMLEGKLGLSIGVPETNVLALDKGYLPPLPNPTGNTVTCSIQEVRANKGSLKGQKAVNPSAESCAALAIYDLVSLNTDRHSGNLLVSDTNDLVPIDQGATFVDPADDDGAVPGTNEAVERINRTVGCYHNALLALPGTHKPITKEMRTKLAALDVDQLEADLKAERDLIATQMPEMQGKVTDHSIAMAKRSTQFLKIGAALEVKGQRLSPAAIQVALGFNAQELMSPPNNQKTGFALDDQAFAKRAKVILLQALRDQPATESFCLTSDGEKHAIAKVLRDRGWQVEGPGGQPTDQFLEPAVQLALLASGETIAKEPKPYPKQRARIKEILAEKRDPKKLNEALFKERVAAARRSAHYLPDGMEGRALDYLKRNLKEFAADPAKLKAFNEGIESGVMAGFEAEQAKLEKRYTLHIGAFDMMYHFLALTDFDQAKSNLESRRKECADGRYPAKNGAAT